MISIRIPFKYHFYQTQVYLGFDLGVRMSLCRSDTSLRFYWCRCWCGTMADEDTNRWSHYSNHCQWGMASGATCCVGQILYQCKWRQLVAKFVDSLGSLSLWWSDQFALKSPKYVFLSNLTLLSCLGPNSTCPSSHLSRHSLRTDILFQEFWLSNIVCC